MVTSEMSSVRHVLHELATQVYNLAMGLQNASPTKENDPPKSVKYLLETSLQIEKAGKTVDELSLVDASKKKL